MDASFLRDKGITCVFNCTKDLPFSPVVKRQYRVPVDDNLQPAELKNMERWSPEIVAKLLHEYNNGQTILVHCFAGKQTTLVNHFNAVCPTEIMQVHISIDEVFSDPAIVTVWRSTIAHHVFELRVNPDFKLFCAPTHRA